VDIVNGILEGITSAVVVAVSIWLWHQAKKYLENQKQLQRRIGVLQTQLGKAFLAKHGLRANGDAATLGL